MRFVFALALALPALALADEGDGPAKTWDDYQIDNETVCVGPANGKQAADTIYDEGGFRYTLNGARARIVRTTPRKNLSQVRLGMVSSIGDDTPETQANLAEYLEKFKAADVDGIVVGGDTAFEEMEIEIILGRVAALGVPVYAIIGNKESRGGWNRALRAAWQSHRNIVNLDLARIVDSEGFDFVTLPGYFDKRYTHQGGSCVYKPEDARALKELATGLDGPVVVISHGPPKQSGKGAIDYVPDAGNVGDPDLADAIAAAKIPFGIFPHILEAGGRGTDLSGKKEVKPLTFAEQLYVNPGGSNSLPWRMNSGPECYGMAGILTIEGKKAKYEIIRSPRRIAVGN